MNELEMLDVLLEQKAINVDQYKITQTERRHSGSSVKEILLVNGFIGDDALARFTSQASGMEFVDFDTLVPDAQAVGMVPVDIARSHLAVPLGFDKNRQELRVAVSNIDDVLNLDSLKAALASRVSVTFFISPILQIHQALDRLYGFELSIDGLLDELEGVTGASEFELEQIDQVLHPVVRLVDAILADALKSRASDIHLEPESSFLRIRYRIDGVLQVVRCVHKNFWPSVAARLKVLSHLDIAETRAPQDGSFSINYSASQVDLRMSTFPTIHGENIVLRLHSGQQAALSLRQLGMTERQVLTVRKSLSNPQGVVLVAGPTGSGKTTTLYAMLAEINTEYINTMSLEDPVECRLPLVRQCDVSGRGKMSFADGIRSILRQDPDVILIGEIRDSVTAELAFRAALTGHLVLATIHASSVIGVYRRLSDLGVDRNLAAQLVKTVLSQRLIRLLCCHCKKTDSTALPGSSRIPGIGNSKAADAVDVCQFVATKAKSVGANRAITGTSCSPEKENDDSIETFTHGGCQECGLRGYNGRTVLAEILHGTPRLVSLVEKNASNDEFHEYLNAIGHVSSQSLALDLLASGQTSLHEVTRVTGPITLGSE